MNVLVTGASGFVGRAVVPALVARGHRVRAATRDASLAFAGAKTVVHGDLAEHIDWSALVDGSEAIVHLAGIAHATHAIPDDRYDAVNHAATDALARAAARASVRKLVFVSSIRAQTGPTAASELSERDAPRPTDAYGRSKLAAEDAVRASGVRHAILRPVLIYGPQLKGNLALLHRLAGLPVPLPFGSSTNRRSLLSLDTMVSAVALALDDGFPANETYLVADKHPLALRELVAALRAARGRRPRLVPVPAWLLRGALRASGRRDMWDRLGGELVADVAKLEATGWHPIEDTAEELGRMARTW